MLPSDRLLAEVGRLTRLLEEASYDRYEGVPSRVRQQGRVVAALLARLERREEEGDAALAG